MFTSVEQTPLTVQGTLLKTAQLKGTRQLIYLLRQFLQQLPMIALQRLSQSSCPLFADAPLAVLHLADVVLRKLMKQKRRPIWPPFVKKHVRGKGNLRRLLRGRLRAEQLVEYP